MKISKTTGLILLITLFLTQNFYAQKTWEKDWQKWNKNDVNKILSDSPWAKSFTNVEVGYGFTSKNRGTFDNGPLVGPAPPIIVRFYSSLKLRQAVLRLRQLQSDYDKMDKKQKSEFDEQSKNFLDCANCKNYYVFILLQPIDKPGLKSLVGDEFRDDQLSDLQGKILLINDKKETRDLTQFAAPKNSTDPAVFYFPKMDENNNPLITKDTKKIKLVIKTTLMRGKEFLQDVEFDVSKMLIDGEFDF